MVDKPLTTALLHLLMNAGELNDEMRASALEKAITAHAKAQLLLLAHQGIAHHVAEGMELHPLSGCVEGSEKYWLRI